MRKSILKLTGIAAAICLVIGMAIPAFAADEGIAYAADADRVGLNSANPERNDVDPIKDPDQKGQVGLKPSDSPEYAYIEFTCEVDNPGTYVVTVTYAASHKDGETRKADMIVNDGERINLEIIESGWELYEEDSHEVEFVAGENYVKLVNSEDYDGTTVKAINVLSVSWTPKSDDETDAPTTEAPTTDAPTTDAPTTDAPTTDAPTTDAPTTQAPTTQAPTTQAPTTQAPAEDEGGCGSALGISAVAMAVTAVFGCAVMGKKH